MAPRKKKESVDETLFMQFNGRILKVWLKNGERVVSFATQEELESAQADLILLDFDPEDLTDNVYQNVLNETFKDLAGEWKANLKANVLKVLGFERDSWEKGEWKVDHCNGRMSSMTTMIAEDVKKHVIDQIKATDIVFTDAEKAALAATCRKEAIDRMTYDYKNHYREAIRKKMESQASEDAEKDLEEFFKTRKVNAEETLRSINYSLKNPQNKRRY